MKTSHDDNSLYFYAETVQDISPASGDNWMTLWINADKSSGTGWYGYDYRIVQGNTLEQYHNGTWKAVTKKNLKYIVEQNKMMITIPLPLMPMLTKPLRFEFKWSDNMQAPDPIDWYINGDAAPGGRFNYQYTAR
jgi:hypothetical protein